MGIMYLSSALKHHGHETSLLDLRLADRDRKALLDWMREFNPDLAGISALSSEALSAHRVAAEVKSSFPDTPVVMGGPYPTVSPGRVMEDANVDYCFMGEGEEQSPRLVESILDGKGVPDRVPGAGFRRDGEVVLNDKAPPIEDVDQVPMPDWEIIDREAYFKSVRAQLVYKHRNYMPLFTSRGCPYQCAYCHKIFGKKFRPHSPERVMEEIKTLHDKYDIREFQVWDDIFNLDHGRAVDIAERIIDFDKDLYLNFPNGVRGDIMDRDLIRMLKRAGTFKINYAVETASPRLQKLIRKNVNLDKLREIIEITDREGILQLGFFMLGFPAETEEEMTKTVQYAKESRLHMAQFFVVNLFECTDLVGIAASAGVDTEKELVRYDYQKPRQQISSVPLPRLEKILKKANREFYLDPRRMARLLYLFPNKSHLPVYAWLFARLALLG